MLLEIVSAIVVGICFGIFTGLIPGIHINLISLIVVSISPLLLQYTTPAALGVFIIAMAITHTFLDSIPGIYLGAPDADVALNVLPGHRMLLAGIGHNALKLTVIGSFFALILAILFIPFLMNIMGIIYPYLKNYIGYLLIVIMFFMILKERKPTKISWALTMFLMAGCLGLIVFQIPTLEQPLFPLLSGMFGFSLLLTSLFQNTTIPEQKFDQPLTITHKNFSKATGAATGIGFCAAFLPGFGSSQAAIIATQLVGDIGDEGFLVLVGGINTVNMCLSIISAYVIMKARNGAIVAITKILGTVDLKLMILFLVTALIAGSIAVFLSLKISKLFCRLIVKLNYKAIVLTILGFITILTFYFDGMLGLLILTTSTAVGLVASEKGVGKNHLMGCLIIPVILYFVL